MVKQEPVAWMETYKGKPHNLDWNKENLNYGDSVYDVVPLFTAPRELSDEEILQIAFARNARIPNNIGNDMLLISFAKALLKKASEK